MIGDDDDDDDDDGDVCFGNDTVVSAVTVSPKRRFYHACERGTASGAPEVWSLNSATARTTTHGRTTKTRKRSEKPALAH